MIARILPIATVICLSSASTAPSIEPHGTRHFRMHFDFNYITEASNHWVSEGIFVDEGTIKHDHTEFFKGGTAKVGDSPAGQFGTFSLTFSKTYTGQSNLGVYDTNGAWKITGGTGKYEGMSGQGILRGALNTVTGQIHDDFIGKLDCPKC